MDRNTKKGIDGNWRKETTVSPGWQKKYVVCPWMLWRFLFNQVPPFTAGPHLYNPSFSQELNDHLGLIWWAGWRRESNSCGHHQDNTLSLSSSVRELDSTYDHPLDIPAWQMRWGFSTQDSGHKFCRGRQHNSFFHTNHWG